MAEMQKRKSLTAYLTKKGNRRMDQHMMSKTGLAALAMGLMLAGTGPALALDEVSYGTNWLAQAEHGGFYQAVADGTYEKHGLKVKIIQGGPNAANRSLLIAGKVERIVLSRPAVEAGERLGFLPGDMKEKVDPYLRPIYDALYDTLPAEQVERRIASGEIEIAPLAFMRGRTLANAFIVLDEAQNTTIAQMKMFLTRFGEGSRMVICGDPRQVDLPQPGISGLADAVARLEGVEGISVVPFGIGDVVRHPVVGRIVQAYEGPDA